jgi:Xaa-Pro aminopeptidase
MTNVLIVADTRRSPEMRHEVPLMIPDPFLYAEVDGRRHVAVGAMERRRIEALGLGLEVKPLEELGIDELARQGIGEDELHLELRLRACRAFGLEQALIPEEFPAATADYLRAGGITLTVDAQHFKNRRRVKTEAELAGIRRAQLAAEAAMASAVDALRRSEARNGGLVLEGEPLTCESLKRRVDQAFVSHGAAAEESVVSHADQTAVGHDLGSGQISADDVVLLDLFPVDKASGCYADMTRTFAIGNVSDEIREYHRLVKEALDLAIAAVKPGVNGRDIHQRVCDFFHEHGYQTQLHKPEGAVIEDGFYHGTGHGVGLAVHEAPYVGRIGNDLVVGDVITIEPGLYRYGFGGVRLEDLVLVTEEGGEVLTDFPYDLEIRQ